MRVVQFQGVPGRLLSSLLAVALVLPAVMVVGVVAAPPAAAAAGLTLTKSAPGQALVGEPVTYTLTATNPGDQPLYNVSFRDVLPLGMTYTAGSTSPASAGEPQVITNGSAPNQVQTLIWSNVADLQPTSTTVLTFKATPDAARLPVGAPVNNTGDVYGSTDPRLLPKFDAAGQPPNPLPGTTIADSDGPRTTTFTAIEVRKSEPSPEGELLRGVHTQTTTYTLEVENNQGFPTNGVTVVDYLPAALEFLHCGGVDNSAPGLVEYTGAPRLTVVPAPAGAGACQPIGGSATPRIDSVDTVALLPGNPQDYPAGVYTRVSYVLGDMAKGATITLKYRAGIPLRQNVPFIPPIATTGVQAANLDNNTGPSTRETAAESAVTNRVRADGTYTGPIVGSPTGGPVSDTDEVTRTIEDLALVKSVTPKEFVQGGLASYTLTLRGSEYVNGSNVVVTDVLPNGVCPLVVAGNPAINTTAAPLGIDCLGDATNTPSTPFTSYVPNSDGTTTVTFAPVSVAANGTTTITYTARMRTLYGGTDAGTGGLAGQPIAAGDSFTNKATLTGTTTPISGSPESGALTGIIDQSEATLPSGGASLDKAIKPRDSTFAEAYDCDGPTSIPAGWTAATLPTPYGDAADFLATPGFDKNRLAFRKGGRVCFQITARFAANTQTRNAVITDFLPDGTSYEPGSFRLVGPLEAGVPAGDAGENNLQPGQVTFNEAEAAAGTQDPTWRLGAPFSGNGANTLPNGAIFQARFSVIVDRGADGSTVDIVGNLAKMRTENSKGQAQSFRDEEPLGIIPPPPLPTVKGVAQVNGVQQPSWNPTTGNDDVLVKQGDLVTYRIDLSNTGASPNGNAVAARQIELWDVLPVGISCADVVGNYTYSPPVDDPTMRVTCFDPGATIATTPPLDNPSTTTPPGRSVIQWKDTSTTTVASNTNGIWAPEQFTSSPPTAPTYATATRSYFYTVRVPAQVSVGTRLVNTAGVRQYGVLTGLLKVAPYFPADNVDPSIDPATYDAPRTRDDSLIRLDTVPVTKGVTSTIAEPGNTGNESSPQPTTQAVPGEVVTYTVTAAVPAQTTVYNATFADPMPTGLGFLSATADWSATGNPAGPWNATLPPGVNLDITGGSPVLRFPATYNNNTTLNQIFRMTIQARVLATELTNVQGTPRTNTATFSSTPALDGGTALTATAISRVDVVEPAVSVVKSTTGDDNGIVLGGQSIAYTLTVANAAGQPPLHDSWTVDCVPAGLRSPTYTSTSPEGLRTLPPTAGTGANGCPVGTTRLAWDTALVTAGTPILLRYSAVVETAAVGAQAYTNVATVAGNSLDGDRPDPTDPGNLGGREYAATDANTLTVRGAASTKSVNKPTATIGEIVTYTVSAVLPPNVNFYDVALVDSLPAGMAPQATGGRPTEVVSTTCRTIAVDTPCDPDITAVPLVGNPAPPNPATANLIGVGLGDLGPSTLTRRLEVVYTARVVDILANTTGRDLLNGVTTRWNLVNGANPTTVTGPWTQSSAPSVAAVKVRQPSLTPTKTVSDNTVEPGQVWTYTVRVTNGSGTNVSPAYEATITDAVPSGVVVDPASLTASNGTLTGTEPDGSGGRITWLIPGPVARGASVIFTYAARLAPSGTINSAVQVNTADVGTYFSLPAVNEPGFDPGFTAGTPVNRRTYNGPSRTAQVTPQFPALAALKTAPAGPIAYVGQPFPWRFEVLNSGTAGAFDVDLVDTLPPNWRYLPGSASVSFAGGSALNLEPQTSVVGAVQTLNWTDAGDLPVGRSAVVTFRAVPLPEATTTPGAGATIAHTNAIEATADDATGASANLAGDYRSNRATAAANINAADVTIVKSAGDFVAGATGSYSLTVRNNGPDPAIGPFVVTDPLPATPEGLAFVSATGTGWTCSLVPVVDTPGTVRCVRTDSADTLLPSGAAATFPPIVITAAVDADVPNGTRYPNTAEVDAVTFDPNLGNNRDDATGVVRTEADLEIVKALSGPLVAGRDATYTLDVKNLGPSVSRADIVVRDTLPLGATFRSAAGEGWDCVPGTGAQDRIVTCTRDTDLAVGEAPGQIALVIGIPSGQTTDVTNVATVESTTTPELTTANNTSSVTTPVVRLADLALEKRHVGAFVAGATGAYEFQVVNNGPSDAAAAVTITDTLPAGLTYASVTSTAGSWGCSAAGQVLTCIRGGASPTTMPTGANETLTVLVNIAQGLAAGPISNTATVSSPTIDPNTSNNTDPDETGTETLADLQLVKTVKDALVTAGDTVTYTLAVTNKGSSVARQLITVTDVIPTGLSWAGPDSAQGTDWSCSYDDPTRTITCTRAADLAAPETPSDPPVAAPLITLVLDVDPDAGPATIVNSAGVKSPTNDPNIGNNTDEVPVQVVDFAEISLVKTRVGTDPVTAGTPVEFQIVVTNAGPSDADQISVVDTLEPGMTATGVAGDGWDCSFSALSYLCTRPVALASADGTPRAAPPITITATVGASVPNGTTLVNTATVRTSTPGDSLSNNTGTADVPVVAIADLVLEKSVRPLPDGETLDAGEQLSYDLLVTNEWKSDAVAPITVIDILPAGFTYAGTAGTGWYCEHVPGAGSPAGDVVTCILGEDLDPDPRQDPLPAGATAPLLSLLVSIDPTVTEGTYSNNAEVSTRTTEVTLENNTDSVPVDVGEQADLSIIKSHTGAARVGDQLTFTLEVSNAGPSVARDVVVTDELPKGLTFVSAKGATGDDWTCSEAASVVTCDLAGVLNPRTTADLISLVVKVGPQAYPSVVNTAEVDSATFDPNREDNKTTDQVDVPALVDLAIGKSHTGSFQVGQRATYTVVVTNNGPTPAPGVVVTDTLPTGLTYVSATGAGVTCAAAGQVVTCTAVEPLGVDKSLTIALTVEVLPTAYPGVTNVVSVSSPSEETRTDNNTATDPAVVSPLVDLDIVKELVDQDGDRAVFEITVTNNGPNATSAPIVVVDDLPVGLQLVAAQGSGWQCGVTEPVTCTYAASLPVGGQVSFGVVATITAPAGATVTNVATVTAGCSPAPSGVQAASVRSSAVDCGSAEADLTVPPLEGDTEGAGDKDGDSGGLADTGATAGPLGLLALAMLVLGGAAVLSSRSRRHY